MCVHQFLAFPKTTQLLILVVPDTFLLGKIVGHGQTIMAKNQTLLIQRV